MMTIYRIGKWHSVTSDLRSRSPRHHVALDAGAKNGAGKLERSRSPTTGAVLGELSSQKNGEEMRARDLADRILAFGAR